MYLSEVIIDGFKSYANRTVVADLDPQFNAITGLNGSGKSNVLDSICFVLGIQNLSNVRATNLIDLVYKQGQAGVSKASVTLVFNNADPKASPVGYENCQEISVTRQVVVGGRNKYLINGHTAQQKQVHDMFHSVQLNVNHPHFLIMQGMITKVLNMKPPEILGMIEEAAGTRMFETKKNEAQKLIEKKQRKVNEINKVLSEEIDPNIRKLRKEYEDYMTWSTISTEIDRLSRYVTAHQYYINEMSIKRSAGKREEMVKEISMLKKASEELNSRIDEKEHEIKALKQKAEKELENAFQEMEENVNEQSKAIVKETSVLEGKKESLEADKKGLKNLEKNIKDSKNNVESLKKKQAQADTVAEEKLRESERLRGVLETCEKTLQALHSGMGSAEDIDSGRSISDRIEALKRDEKVFNTESKQAAMAMKHLTSEIKDLKKEVAKSSKEYDAFEAQRTALDTAVAKLKKKLDAVGYEEGTVERLQEQEAVLRGRVHQARERVDGLSAKLTNLDFSYSAPSPNFDRSKVKGLVAKLIKVQDPKHATALEVTAGGRLFNVVVDSEVTGSELLKKGKLKRRVTIIPLNKIIGNKVSSKQIQAAQEVGGKENVSLALSLVGYDRELEAAMAYCFGRTFVCKDMDVANTVTFHPRVATRSVTLDGDLFDPVGTLTGGSQTHNFSVLTKLRELGEETASLERLEAELAALADRLKTARDLCRKYEECAQAYELKRSELDMLAARMRQSSHGALVEKLKDVEAKFTAQEQAVSEAERKEQAARENRQKLEKQHEEFAQMRESNLKRAEKELAQVKKEHAKAEETAKEARAKRETLQLEVESQEGEVEALETQRAEELDSLAAAEKVVLEIELQVAELAKQFDLATAQLAARKQELNCTYERVGAMEREREEMRRTVDSNGHREYQLKIDISNDEDNKAKSLQNLKLLLQKYPWINTDKALFGQPSMGYDFAKYSASQAEADLEEKKSQQEKLEHTVNKKVINMLDKAEEEYKSLVEKKSIITLDKNKIESVIRELEEKKKDALQKTWSKVNSDFGTIFSSLLPGTNAKLDPVEGGSVLDGLEVKVAFGDVWKESLTELSGGQRSLLALSLVLALLLFKPAPFYILDEIDAALDLSHTQNIGTMLRRHFKHSQFIIVSLKEGMFNNANVLYRVRFIDGVSTITRTVSGHRKALEQKVRAEDEDDPENVQNAAARGKKRSRRR